MNLTGLALNLHKLPITVIYISLLLSCLLSLPATETPDMAFKIGKRNV